MAYTKLIPRHSPGASVQEISRGEKYRLSIPTGSAAQYRIAQLDDYAKKSRVKFPLRSPLLLSLSARVSSQSIPGTWGFGLWNDPFGLSIGFGGNPFRLPALPNAVWFFGASKESYLSFKELPASSSLRSAHYTCPGGQCRGSPDALRERESAANGFIAQTFRSPRFHSSLILAGLALPFSRKMTRRMLGKIIDEDGIRLSVDVTQWHRYKLEWRENRVLFSVDNIPVFESHVSPHPPLGLVIWIDNQYAAFTPEGKIGFGVLENPEPASLEIDELSVS